MRTAAGADPVELDQIALDVRLQHGARDSAVGEAAERVGDGRRGRRERDVALLRVVHVRALHPDGQRARIDPLVGRDEAALDERHVRLGEGGDHPLAVRVLDRPRTVDLRHAAQLEVPQSREHVEALAHQEDEARPVVGFAHLVRGLERDLVPLGLEVLTGQSQDLGVVRLAARRVSRFSKNAPAARVIHAHPPDCSS